MPSSRQATVFFASVNCAVEGFALLRTASQIRAVTATARAMVVRSNPAARAFATMMNPRSSRTAHLTAAICAVALLGCSNATEPVDPVGAPASVEGCYSVALGKWSGPHESPDPPSSIRLTGSFGNLPPELEHRVIEPDPVTTSMPFDRAWWARPAKNHLSLLFSDGGYVGARMSLVWGWGDSTWRGTVEAYTDVGEGTQATATVTLAPRSCS